MSRIITLFFIVITAVSVSCDDVFERDIADEQVVLRTPADGYHTTTQSVTFSWEAVTGASGYHVIVATPDYEHADRIVVDTVVTRVQFVATLSEGGYQWCVRAINSGYETAYTCRMITVADVIEVDISGQAVVLRGPSDVYQTTIAESTFWWDTLAGATKYQFLVVSPTFQNPESQSVDTLITSSKLVKKLPVGSYQWCVRALNSDYQTVYTCRTIVVNKDISTQTVALRAPAEGYTTSTSDVTLWWNALDGVQKYRLQVVSPTQQNPNTIPIDVEVTATQYVVRLSPGRYQWCIKGMNGKYETSYVCRSITIQ